MTSADPTPPGDDPDVAAAELALGLLEGDDRAAALRRQLADPAFAREVEQWRDHFALLFAETAAVEPGAALAPRVEQQLDSATAPRPVANRIVEFWRPLAVMSSLAAASLAAVLVMRVDPTPVVIAPPTPQAQLVAALAPAEKGAPVALYYDAAQQLVRMPAPMDIPAGHSAQLWAIKGDKPPVPLGLFRVVGTTIIADAKSAAALEPGTILAISIEPVGGSPTGAPTGPVVASGALSRV